MYNSHFILPRHLRFTEANFRPGFSRGIDQLEDAVSSDKKSRDSICACQSKICGPVLSFLDFFNYRIPLFKMESNVLVQYTLKQEWESPLVQQNMNWYNASKHHSHWSCLYTLVQPWTLPWSRDAPDMMSLTLPHDKWDPLQVLATIWRYFPVLKISATYWLRSRGFFPPLLRNLPEFWILFASLVKSSAFRGKTSTSQSKAFLIVTFNPSRISAVSYITQ